jgi:hypothetical protein
MMVEARIVHASDEIVRNSILQAGFGLQNVVVADEVGHRGYGFSLWSFWQVVELKRSSRDQITPVLWIQPKWISTPGQTMSPASKVS